MAQSEGLHHAVIVYGADWCGDTTRTRQYLTDLDIEFNYYNIDKDEAMKRTAEALSGGTTLWKKPFTIPGAWHSSKKANQRKSRFI